MKTSLLTFITLLASLTSIRAENKPVENPVAAQFRQHLQDADVNKNGFVAREELVAEISKGGGRKGVNPIFLILT